MSKKIGFEVTETVSTTFVNYAIPTGMASARELVGTHLLRGGYYRWVMKGGGCLALVDYTYELKEWERFLVEVKPNQFQAV